MSEQLSFTQALRENGFTQSNENSQNNNNEDTIEKAEKVEKVSNENIIKNNYTNDDEEQVVYIGSKSVMSYVFSLVNILNDESNVISIQARGRAINRAVDVVEVLRHRFITDLTIEDISISTQQIVRDDGRESNVSAINIIIRN